MAEGCLEERIGVDASASTLSKLKYQRSAILLDAVLELNIYILNIHFSTITNGPVL